VKKVIEEIKTGISQCNDNDTKSDRLPQVICPLKENTISGILIEFEEISRRCKKFFENKNNKKLENVDGLLKELDKFIRLFRECYTLEKELNCFSLLMMKFLQTVNFFMT